MCQVKLIIRKTLPAFLSKISKKITKQIVIQQHPLALLIRKYLSPETEEKYLFLCWQSWVGTFPAPGFLQPLLLRKKANSKQKQLYISIYQSELQTVNIPNSNTLQDYYNDYAHGFFPVCYCFTEGRSHHEHCPFHITGDIEVKLKCSSNSVPVTEIQN